MILLDTVDSTNAWCLRQVDALETGTVVMAEEQTAGRGRHGRRWYSPPGRSLYTSILLKAPFLRVDVQLFPQLASLAIHDALRDVGVAAAWIKWPNDLLVAEKKIAGVLCESRLSGGRVDAVVVGMGVNLNVDEEELAGLDQPATSVLLETGATTGVRAFAECLYRYFQDSYRQTQQFGFGILYDRWLAASRLPGRRVRLSGPAGSVEGVVRTLRQDGALVLVADDGSESVHFSGEVSLRLADGDAPPASGSPAQTSASGSAPAG